MAQFSQNSYDYTFATAYLERCKQIQKLANLHPEYQQIGIPSNKKDSPVIVLDDDDPEVVEMHNDNNAQTSCSLQTSRYPNNQHPSYSNPSSVIEVDTVVNLEESSDLHITGVSVLKEWIDISELNVGSEAATAQMQSPEIIDQIDSGSLEVIDTEMYIPADTCRFERYGDYHNQSVSEIRKNKQVSSEKPKEIENSEVEIVAVINENWADVNVEGESDTEEQKKAKQELPEKEAQINQECEAQINQEKEAQINQEREAQKSSDNPGEPTESSKSADLQTGSEKFKCDHCSYRTNWKSNLSKHVISRHQSVDEIKWFECAHCPYKGKTREYLRTHLRQCHEQFITWSNCPKCPLKFKAKQFLEAHILSIHTAPEDIEWFKCELCDFKCKFKLRLKHHKLHRHTDESEIPWFQCKSCKYRGKTKKALKKHEFNKHTDYDRMVWFKCEKCEYETTNKVLLRKHVKNRHDGVVNLENDISEKELECKMCGFKTYGKSKFMEHFGWSNKCYY